MKKLSMTLAAVALVAVGCDPYDDVPNSGNPQVATVTAAGRLAHAVVAETELTADGFWLLDDGVPVDGSFDFNGDGTIEPEDLDDDGDSDANGFIEPEEFELVEDDLVPVGAGGNNVIVVTSNTLLDGNSIQTAPQDLTDAASTGDCRPANGWLTITKNPGTGPVGEPLNYPDPADATASNYQWYSCYYPAAATSSFGSSIEIFRARVNTPPGLTTATRPLSIATLEAGTTYEITGSVNSDGGAALPINVRVVTRPEEPPAP